MSRYASSSPPRFALVTGSSTGIGRETTLQLAELGFRVFAGVRRLSDGEAVVAEATRRGGVVTPVLLDVTRADQIDSAALQISREVGPHGLAALVNNAGIPVVGPVEALPLDRWRHQFEVNLFGQIAVTRAVLPMLRVAKGRVVLVSSIAGLVGQPFLGPYSASKHALEALGDALRLELAPDGIGVTLIEPGAIKTPIWRRGEENTKSAEDEMPADLRDRYADRMAKVKRMAADAEAKGLETPECARVIVRALTARRVPVRVVVGRDAKIGALLKSVLPARTFDWFVRKAFGV
jgi:NAD(P)-dependent dehydrogenase (short-subunit alcohol dehydrogenase family)